MSICEGGAPSRRSDAAVADTANDPTCAVVGFAGPAPPRARRRGRGKAWQACVSLSGIADVACHLNKLVLNPTFLS